MADRRADHGCPCVMKRPNDCARAECSEDILNPKQPLIGGECECCYSSECKRLPGGRSRTNRSGCLGWFRRGLRVENIGHRMLRLPASDPKWWLSPAE